MTSSSSKKTSKKQPSSLIQFYLLIYNVAQAVGWTYVLVEAINYYLHDSGPLYNKIKWQLIICQGAAVLEIFHAVLGLVASSPTVVMQQISSRFVVVYCAMVGTAAGNLNFGFPICMLAYGFNETLRYGFYALNIVGIVPFPVLWLRYTTFIITYPMGLLGEFVCLYFGYQEMSQLKLGFSDMTLYSKYLVLGALIIYGPMFFRLYLYMFAQRKKALGKPKTTEAAMKAK